MINAGLLQNISLGFSTTTILRHRWRKGLPRQRRRFIPVDAGGMSTGSRRWLPESVSYQATSGGVVLDGRQSPVTITAGATLNDVFHTFDASFTFDNAGSLSLLGTIDCSAPSSARQPGRPGRLVRDDPTAGLLSGRWDGRGYLDNTGTVLAQIGHILRPATSPIVARSGTRTGATFHLGGATGETVDLAAPRMKD